MSEMPSREEFEQYKSLRDKGDYRAAAKVLLPYKDNPKVRTLIQQLKAAHQSGAIPPRKPVGKQKPKANMGKRLLWAVAALIGICGVIFAAYFIWYYATDQKGKGETFGMELDLWSLCFDIYYEDYFIDEFSEAFSEGCWKEARSMMVVWRDEIEYCWRQSSEGALERQFINCLVDNDVSMSDIYIITEMSRAIDEATEEATNP